MVQPICFESPVSFRPERRARYFFLTVGRLYAFATVIGACMWSSLPTSSARVHRYRHHGRADGTAWNDRSFKEPGAVFNSMHTGRKYIATVISMESTTDDRAGNNTRRRMSRFRHAWSTAWPRLQIRQQVSFRNHDSLRGIGLSASFLIALEEALQVQDFDVLLVFEDDAIPFPEVVWPGQGPNDLDSHINKLEERHGAGLFLGGHAIKGYNGEDVNKELPSGVVRATAGFGSYAVAIPKKSIPFVVKRFREALAQPPESSIPSALKLYSTDVILWWAFAGLQLDDRNSSGAYISTPLLVDHATGFSNTWNMTLNRKFEGRRDFWNFED